MPVVRLRCRTSRAQRCRRVWSEQARPAEHWVVFPPPPLVARVVVGPVPDIPLASLAGFIEPVADDEGRVVDWLFNRDGSYDAADLKAYGEWRGSWERAMGARAAHEPGVAATRRRRHGRMSPGW